MPFHCEPVADVARWSETTLEMYLKDMQSADELVQMNRIVCLFNATTFESEPIPPWAHIAGGALNFRRGSIQELGLDTDRELGDSALFEKGYSHAHGTSSPSTARAPCAAPCSATSHTATPFVVPTLVQKRVCSQHRPVTPIIMSKVYETS